MAELLAPVSVGELIDKITILRIKRRMITDAAKLTNIEAEMAALLSVCKKANIDPDAPLARDLEAINVKLWKIEDDIRDLERSKNFDAAFVALARAVYITNDERFATKSKINQVFGSSLKEEKSYQSY